MATALEGRLARGKAIAASGRLRPAPDGTTWVVLSQSQPKTRYTVDTTKSTCTCPDFEEWGLDCKHIFAVRFFQDPEFKQGNAQCEETTMPVKQSYGQDWRAYNAGQVLERQYFEGLLQGLCRTIKEPPQGKGRPRIPVADMTYSAVTKVYGGFSGRRASTDIRECREHGHIDHAPHYNSISRFLGMEELTPILKQLIELSALPLKAIESQFAVDATGFSTCVYDRWFDYKYGKAEEQKRQRWIKAHAMVGCKTNVITAIEVTESYVSDTSQLPDLLRKTTANFNVQELSADKAYLSRYNLTVTELLGAKPFIPFKSDSQGAESSDAWSKLWRLFWFKQDEFSKHYHQRSNVESTFSALKRKLGGSVKSKDMVAQYNEVLCKVLAYNITVVIHEMFELGITPDFANACVTH